MLGIEHCSSERKRIRGRNTANIEHSCAPNHTLVYIFSVFNTKHYQDDQFIIFPRHFADVKQCIFNDLNNFFFVNIFTNRSSSIVSIGFRHTAQHSRLCFPKVQAKVCELFLSFARQQSSRLSRLDTLQVKSVSLLLVIAGNGRNIFSQVVRVDDSRRAPKYLDEMLVDVAFHLGGSTSAGD